MLVLHLRKLVNLCKRLLLKQQFAGLTWHNPKKIGLFEQTGLEAKLPCKNGLGRCLVPVIIL